METSAGYAVETAKQSSSNRKVKKINFFKKWLLQNVKDAVDHERNQPAIAERDYHNSPTPLISARQAGNIDQPERAIHFTVYTANGGRVVETRRTDRKTDRSTTGLYIITSEQDFGREIDKIITMEALR